MDQDTGKAIAIYHDMRVHEDFELCAQRLFKMVQNSVKKWPGKRRILYLDIQGHRNDSGGYDGGAFEILKEFILGFLMPFLSEANTPLYRARNPRGQRNDLPDELYKGPRFCYQGDGAG